MKSMKDLLKSRIKFYKAQIQLHISKRKNFENMPRLLAKIQLCEELLKVLKKK